MMLVAASNGGNVYQPVAEPRWNPAPPRTGPKGRRRTENVRRTERPADRTSGGQNVRREERPPDKA